MKNLIILLSAISILISPAALAQVSISTDGSAPHSSAMLEVKSIDRGILVPRLTTVQREGISGPAEGLLVYDNDTDSFWFYSGSLWQELRTGAGTELTDADNDTKVTVDNGSDEDLIRFQLGGAEKMVLRINSLDLNPGNDNVIVAPFSGSLITSASNNSIFGYSSGQMNTTGNYNSFFGSSVGLNNIDGNSNVAMGAYSLTSNTSGDNNTTIGNQAGFGSISGDGNIFLGYKAGDNLTTGSYNIVIGNDKDFPIPDGDNQMVLGAADVLYGDLSTKRIGIGTTSPTQQLELTGSLEFPQTTSDNTGVIYKDDERFIHNYQPVGAYGGNTFVGINSGNFTMSVTEYPGPESSSFNTAIGYNSLHSTTTGYSNTAIGYSSLYANTEGFSNTAIGNNALYHNHYTCWNTAVGDEALHSNNFGNSNVAFGSKALYSHSHGDGNTAIGNASLYNNITGYYNTVLGYHAGFGYPDNSFSNNTLVGSMTGCNLTTGSDNILIGYMAGDNLTTGFKNIIIGYDIDAKAINGMEEMILGHPDLLYGDITNKRIGIGTPSPQAQLHLENDGDVLCIIEADADNNTGGEDDNPRLELRQDEENVIGAMGFIGLDDAIYTNSKANALYLMNDYNAPLHLGANNSIAMTILGNGMVGIATNSPSEALDVQGNARFRWVISTGYSLPLNLTSNGTLTTASSDIRLKTNIETLNEGLDMVMKLRGVEFNWKSDPDGKKMIGFIAQETEQVVPELVFTNPTDGYMGINYAEMTAVLVEAVKQQQKMIEELQKKVEELETR